VLLAVPISIERTSVTIDVDSWERRGLCHRHPTLDIDAWEGVQGAGLTMTGAKARLICLQCPVMQTCREKYAGIETIGGGGWYDHRGRFQQIPEGHMDVYTAAAYLGVPERVIRHQMGKKLHTAKKLRGRALFTVDEVKILAKEVGPMCGTTGAYEVHLLRGEPACDRCEPVAELLVALKERLAVG
jgi:hypothetical protein